MTKSLYIGGQLPKTGRLGQFADQKGAGVKGGWYSSTYYV